MQPPLTAEVIGVEVFVGAILRINAPGHGQVTAGFFQRRDGQDWLFRALHGRLASSVASNRKAGDAFGVDVPGDRPRREDDGGSGCPVGNLGPIRLQVLRVVRVSLNPVDDSLLHQDRFLRVLWVTGTVDK